MKKIILNVLFTIYAIIAVFTTVCLLSYNQYKITEFGNYSLVIINDDSLAPSYNKGELVIVNKTGNTKIKTGESLFFYNEQNRKVFVSVAKVVDQQPVTQTETTYTLDGDYKISSSKVLGSTNGVKIIKNLGTVLGVIESKWGFLFLIVLPSLIAFIYEIGTVVS